MSFVRNLLSDLVARRLWPVAVVLLAALVAVPVLLAGDVDAPPAPQASAQPATGSSPLVSVASDEPIGGRTPIGRNPFKQKRVAPPSEPTPSPGDAAEPGSGSGSGSDSGSGGGLDLTGGLPALDDVDLIPVGGGDDQAAPESGGRGSYRVDIRFGRDGSLTARNDVPRLSPLPSADDPFFVFMGVLADGKTALFLVSSDAEATGDGTCKPTPENCERIEMQVGESEFFDVTTPDGQSVQYQLDLVRVSRVKSPSTAKAAGARARESAEGREVLRQAIDTEQVDVDHMAYSRELGVIVPSAAAGAGADAGALFGGFRTDLRFGAPGALVKRYNLARLTPLPSTEDPSFLYLGVMGDASDPKALFLNPSQAAVTGDAVCNPTPEECSRIELRPGQSGVLDVPTLDGETDEYELAVDAITEVEAETPAEARRLLRRESPAGRIVLRRLITEVGGLVGDLDYSSSEGRLVAAK